MSPAEAERQIRELLVTETRATTLSNKLFTPDGLFNQIAHNDEERRELVTTDLWRDAQARLRELQYQEAAALAEATKVIHERLPSSAYRIWLEPIETK
jgi:hypothetical protein